MEGRNLGFFYCSIYILRLLHNRILGRTLRFIQYVNTFDVSTLWRESRTLMYGMGVVYPSPNKAIMKMESNNGINIDIIAL